ncbi:MAG: hypothetical protein ACMXYK_01555 [Candidatus Woesearchaeota archaeon]
MDVIKTGTTTIAIKCRDGVVLAADKRTTRGHEVVNRNKAKVLPLTDNVMMTTAGVVSDIQRIVKVIKSQIKLTELKLGRKMLVKEIVAMLTNMVYGNIRTPSTIMPITGFLIGGSDVTGNFVFEIGPDGSYHDVDTFTADGSGGVYATSVLEDAYKDGLSIKDAVALAKRAINVSLLRDTASGNGFLIYSINENGCVLEADEKVDTSIRT